jgi:hypothetical protein
MTQVRVLPAPIVRLHCHATAPGAVGARCGGILGDLPGPLRFVGLSARAPTEQDGMVWVRCTRKDCRTWNVFAPVTIGEGSDDE